MGEPPMVAFTICRGPHHVGCRRVVHCMHACLIPSKAALWARHGTRDGGSGNKGLGSRMRCVDLDIPYSARITSCRCLDSASRL